eukprot:superscaffoldBa00009717_g24274
MVTISLLPNTNENLCRFIVVDSLSTTVTALLLFLDIRLPPARRCYGNRAKRRHSRIEFVYKSTPLHRCLPAGQLIANQSMFPADA